MTTTERNTTIEKNLPLVRHWASRCARNRSDREDMVQEGVVGLCEAAKTYNPSKCPDFLWYGRRRAVGKMLGSRRAAEESVELDRVVDDQHEHPPFDEIENLRSAIMVLPEYMREILKARFWEGKTITETWQSMTGSWSFIRYSEQEALRRLRLRLVA